MSIQLSDKDLMNTQQMEVAVNGPDGATHLVLCTGMANLGPLSHETYSFRVGPQLSRRQFVGVIASGGLSTVLAFSKNSLEGNAIELEAELIAIYANYDDEAGQVKVRAEVASSKIMTKLSISYNVSILAELPIL